MTRCPVTEDRLKFESAQDKAELAQEANLKRAWQDMAYGLLIDEIIDTVQDDATDAVAITLYTLYPDLFFEPRCSLRDMRATIEAVVERRAERIGDEI